MLKQRCSAANVQKRFLLAGERGIGQVFGGSARPHRHRQGIGVCAFARAQFGVGALDCGGERIGNGRGDDPRANFSAGSCNRGEVVRVQRGNTRCDAFIEPACCQRGAVCTSSDNKARRHRQASARQFTQVCAFAAGLGQRRAI